MMKTRKKKKEMNTKYIAILCVDTSYVLIVPSLPPPPTPNSL